MVSILSDCFILYRSDINRAERVSGKAGLLKMRVGWTYSGICNSSFLNIIIYTIIIKMPAVDLLKLCYNVEEPIVWACNFLSLTLVSVEITTSACSAPIRRCVVMQFCCTHIGHFYKNMEVAVLLYAHWPFLENMKVTKGYLYMSDFKLQTKCIETLLSLQELQPRRWGQE